MLIHLARIVAIGIVLLGCLFLPFLPGEYDGFSGGLAVMTMLFGFGGLLLAPVGIGWLVFEIFKRRLIPDSRSRSRVEYHFAVGALICSVPVIALVAFGGWVTVGTSAAVLSIAAFAAFVAWRIVPKLKRLHRSQDRHFNAAPLYLLTLPSLVVFCVVTWGSQAEDFSRERAMANAVPLIDDIEAYQQRTGRYPMSLHSEVEDYGPRLRGIKRYYYEPNGEGYNVFFEQFTYVFGTQKFVVYNTRGEHEFTAHNMDLLQIPSAEIRRGYHAVEGVGPHWKQFLFD